jgi:hypothetical protein
MGPPGIASAHADQPEHDYDEKKEYNRYRGEREESC